MNSTVQISSLRKKSRPANQRDNSHLAFGVSNSNPAPDTQSLLVWCCLRWRFENCLVKATTPNLIMIGPLKPRIFQPQPFFLRSFVISLFLTESYIRLVCRSMGTSSRSMAPVFSALHEMFPFQGKDHTFSSDFSQSNVTNTSRGIQENELWSSDCDIVLSYSRIDCSVLY